MFLHQRLIHCLLLLACCITTPTWAVTSIDVNIDGLDFLLKRNANAWLSVEQLSDEDIQKRSASSLRRLIRQGDEEIRKALQPYGYYQVEIQQQLQDESDDWVVNYQVTLGARAKVAIVEALLFGHGKDNAALHALLAKLPIQVGQPLDHANYESAKAQLRQLAEREGYLDAKYILSELRVNPSSNQAQIHLCLETGPRYYFGPIEFEQTVLRPALLERYHNLKAGDPFDFNRLLQLQYALTDSEYFANIELQPDKSKATGTDDDGSQQLPIKVKLSPAKRHRYIVGLGYATDIGPKLNLGWLNRRVNDRGHRWRNELEYSPQRSQLFSEYRIPIEQPRTDFLSIRLGAEEDRAGAADLERRLLLGINRTVVRKWQHSIYLNFELERFEIADQSDVSRLLLPGYTISRIKADDRLLPRQGWQLQWDIHGTDKSLGSTVRFLQSTLQGRWIQGLSQRSRLLLGAGVGMTWVEDFENLPTSQRYFAGGDASVRGYGYQDLSPRDSTGERTGGENLVTASAELDYMFTDSIGVAAFIDAGNAFDGDNVQLRKGVGIGFRWRLPFGSLRIDLAWPLNDDERDSPRLHLTLGPDL